MFTLTSHRMQMVRPILDRYREQLMAKGRFDARQFEVDLKHALGTGYRELKDVAAQLAAGDQYRGISAYYMENVDPTCMCGEFQRELSKLYGVEINESEPSEREAAKAAFWGRINRERTAHRDESET